MRFITNAERSTATMSKKGVLRGRREKLRKGRPNETVHY
jgi:hypothetical protein